MVFSNTKLYYIISGVSIIFFMIVLILYHFEKNIITQQYLPNVHKQLTNLENKFDLVNANPTIVDENGVIIINNFLDKKYFKYIKDQFENKEFKSRDFMLRKASGINFFNLHKDNYKGLIELYYSNRLLDELSNVLQKPIQRISLSDPNACSLLIYSNKGDHIDWHYDYSSIYGDRYVVLLTIINENSKSNSLSKNKFKYKYKGKMYQLKMQENSVIIFKGSELIHQSTAIDENERRILLSMVFCDICQEKKNVFNQIYEKTKNFAFYN